METAAPHQVRLVRLDRNFGFLVPTALEGVPAKILDPRQTWKDGSAYGAQAQMLVGLFIANFSQYEAHVSAEVKAAAPPRGIITERVAVA